MTDTLAYILVLGMAAPATAFPIIYAFRPWRRSIYGWALMTHSIGMALLIDISLLYKALGSDYPGRDLVRLGVYLFILAGTWAMTIALLKTPSDQSKPSWSMRWKQTITKVRTGRDHKTPDGEF